MELQQPLQHTYSNHDPSELLLPAVPSHDIGTAQKVQLPCLRAVLSPEFDQVLNGHSTLATPTSMPMLPRIEPYSDMFVSPHSRTISQPKDHSDQDRGRPQSLLSEDVRIAAEALSGLGNPGFVRSPTQQSFHSSPTEALQDEMQIDKLEDNPEPLLQLVAQAHPWVGGTINGSIHAYNTTLHYSPHFIKYGANLVERNIATPMVNTVGTVGRYTGMEDGIRRYLGGRRPSELDATERAQYKAAIASSDSMDIDILDCSEFRRGSHETLPAYRASKPPSYREECSPSAVDRVRSESRSANMRSWPSQVAGQILVTTSGLGVALSVTSRRSLQFCLSLLSQATEHVATVTNALRMVLEQYDQARVSWHRQYDHDMEKGQRARTPDHDEASRRLAELIKHHCDDIWQTLKVVVNNVSNIAGGALPENALHFVRTQLMSLPQRWRIVSEQQSGDSETSRGAHRMIAFATEGLDMMSQVSQVCRATLESAEKWLDRAGRRQNDRPTLDEKSQETIDSALASTSTTRL